MRPLSMSYAISIVTMINMYKSNKYININKEVIEYNTRLFNEYAREHGKPILTGKADPRSAKRKARCAA
jgi:hypothetical protein